MHQYFRQNLTFIRYLPGNFISLSSLNCIFFQKLLKEKFAFEITTFRVGKMEEKARQSQTIFASEKHRYVISKDSIIVAVIKNFVL